MKLRIEDNSLRLRLSAAEVAQFTAAGRLESVVRLGPLPTDRLTYALEQVDAAEFQFSYAAGSLTVLVPAAAATAWLTTEQNGLSASVAVAENQALRILVEKDLDCRH
ncbi:DUF7009 family protein [Hymenobacter lucidus]|uniref:Uncharacterized protein n=1 Tax=Hymenobacter lucidus TaxID=2880930 RepID=A0ABS8AK67_9BACT|nr:hypothetical protein [Hymenobacter lucidus]MCB2406529.1 hypothetical protein [Hymenobacter lucidus]